MAGRTRFRRSQVLAQGLGVITDAGVESLLITAAGDFQSAAASNLNLNTLTSDRTVRINSRTYTAAAAIIGAETRPTAGVTLTAGLTGMEVEPQINTTFAGTSITGVLSRPWKRGTGAAGNITAAMTAFDGQLRADSGYTGTITGPAAVVRAVNSLHGTVTNGPTVIHVLQQDGTVVWDSLVHGTEALGTHSLTTNTDRTANARTGTIRVRFGGTVHHIQLYA